MKAGFARIDVTPPKGTCIASRYFYFVPSEGFLDEIEVNALALADEKGTVVLLAADFGGMTQKYMNDFRARVSERTGLPLEHISITTLHQHSSFVVSDPEESDTPVCEPYILEWLRHKFCDVAEMAIADLKDATLHVASAQTAEQISFIRRNSKVEDPSAPDGHRYVSYGPEPDNNVYLARFMREGAEDIVLLNFGTHPDVVGSKCFSNEWPGAARRYVEQDVPGVHCVLINGFQGDVNHIDYYNTDSAGRKAMHGYDYACHMGRVIADTAVSLLDAAKPCACDTVTSKTELLYTKTRTDGEEHREDAARLVEEYNRSHTVIKCGLNLAEAQRILEIRSAPIYQKIPITLITVGDLVIVGIGAEPFTEYGTDARAILKDKFVMTACLTNGYECYMPTEKAFEKHDYAVTRSRFTPALQQETRQMIAKLAGVELN